MLSSFTGFSARQGAAENSGSAAGGADLSSAVNLLSDCGCGSIMGISAAGFCGLKADSSAACAADTAADVSAPWGWVSNTGAAAWGADSAMDAAASWSGCTPLDASAVWGWVSNTGTAWGIGSSMDSSAAWSGGTSLGVPAVWGWTLTGGSVSCGIVSFAGVSADCTLSPWNLVFFTGSPFVEDGSSTLATSVCNSSAEVSAGLPHAAESAPFSVAVEATAGSSFWGAAVKTVFAAISGMDTGFSFSSTAIVSAWGAAGALANSEGIGVPSPVAEAFSSSRRAIRLRRRGWDDWVGWLCTVSVFSALFEKGASPGVSALVSTFAIFSVSVAETGISLSEADCGVFSSAAFVSGAACSSSGTGFVMGHSGTSRDGHSTAGAVVSAVVETEGTQLRGWASPSDGLRCKYLGTPSASFSTGRWDSGIYSGEGLSSTAFSAGDPSIGLCQRG